MNLFLLRTFKALNRPSSTATLCFINNESLEMIQDKQLYWKYWKVWIFGGIISFTASSLIGYLLNNSDPNLIVPITLTIFLFPILLCGILGIRWGYFPSRKIGHIHHGNKAIMFNGLFIFLYFIAIVLAISSKIQ